MRIEVNITKRYFFIFVGVFVLLAGLFVATAYGTTTPSTFGHTPGEIASGVFGGISSDIWTFPGSLKTTTTNDAVLSVEDPNANTYAYVDWKQGGTGRFWSGLDNAGVFRISSRAASADPSNGISIAPSGQVTVVTPDRFRVVSTNSLGSADNPTIALQGPTDNRWDIIFRGPTYAAGGNPGSANDLVISFFNASANQYTKTFVFKENGALGIPNLPGSGSFVCVDAQGNLYRSVAACA